MIFLILPYNHHSGWGICSTNLAKEISKKHKIKYVSTELNSTTTVNPIEYNFFNQCKFDDFNFLKNQTDYPIIHALEHDLKPYFDYFSGSKRIGITFSDRKIPANRIQLAKQKYDYIIAGSEWSKELLANQGIDSIVIHQGIDPNIFNKFRSEKVFYQDDFVVFSGGKYETRKGQDITIKAYKVLQDKYPDVKLVCAWSNAYTGSNGLDDLVKSKIDMNRVILVPLTINFVMSEIYQNTDIGVFPSRCEAGTNLVLMEYMACGKPAIASIGTGQKDIISEKNGLPLNSKGDFLLKNEKNETESVWEQPDLDHLVHLLEWSYENRSKIKKLGREASLTMSKKTWSTMAESILNLIK